jgi:hypothetical protein
MNEKLISVINPIFDVLDKNRQYFLLPVFKPFPPIPFLKHPRTPHTSAKE